MTSPKRPRGRPRLGAKALTETMPASTTRAEAASIRRAAKRDGLSARQWMREAALARLGEDNERAGMTRVSVRSEHIEAMRDILPQEMQGWTPGGLVRYAVGVTTQVAERLKSSGSPPSSSGSDPSTRPADTGT